LVLPCNLLVRGFQLNIFLTLLVSGILHAWPNQLRKCCSFWTNSTVFFSKSIWKTQT
jgi:hypothetical protein